MGEIYTIILGTLVTCRLSYYTYLARIGANLESDA